MSRKEMVIPCHGVSQKTGKRVGYRHRWSQKGGGGYCIWCGRYFDEVFVKPEEAGR